MANKTLPSSSGYFNKEMLAILNKGEKKASSSKKTSKSGSKRK
jgi:hypothetical protein